MKQQKSPSFENEKTQCKDIYEVLSHIAIFKPLISCLFPEMPEGFWINHWWTESRKIFLKDENNLQLILEYFKDENNLAKFAEEVENFYLKHKKGLEKSWIGNPQKNIYSCALSTIRNYIIESPKEQVEKWMFYKTPNLSYLQEKCSLVEDINRKFLKIIDKQFAIDKQRRRNLNFERSIIWDSFWNIVNDSWEWMIHNIHWIEVALVSWRYIDIDTRKVFKTKNGSILIEILDEFIPIEFGNLKKCGVIDTGGSEINVYLKDDLSILKDNQWKEISEINTTQASWIFEINTRKYNENGSFSIEEWIFVNRDLIPLIDYKNRKILEIVTVKDDWFIARVSDWKYVFFDNDLMSRELSSFEKINNFLQGTKKNR